MIIDDYFNDTIMITLFPYQPHSISQRNVSFMYVLFEFVLYDDVSFASAQCTYVQYLIVYCTVFFVRTVPSSFLHFNVHFILHFNVLSDDLFFIIN